MKKLTIDAWITERKNHGGKLMNDTPDIFFYSFLMIVQKNNFDFKYITLKRDNCLDGEKQRTD